jgi:hypothetical protein
MKNKRLLICVFATLIIVLMPLVMNTAVDRSSGTCKMNSAKSKYDPEPAPKDQTVVIESDKNNFKLEATGTNGDGKPLHVQYSAKFNGKDYPATEIPNADSVSVKRIDANTIALKRAL